MIIASTFRPAPGLAHPHLQTLGAYALRRGPRLPTETRTLHTLDGDRLRLDLCGSGRRGQVLVCHGLEGCIESGYAQSLVEHLQRADFGVVFMHFRGCGGWLNRYAPSYHAGHTEDIRQVMRECLPASGPRYAVGFSLGANALLKYLAEEGEQVDVQAAVAVSAPLVLQRGAQRLNRGSSKLLYQRYLLRLMKASTLRKMEAGQPMPLSREALLGLQSLRDFDHRVTAPLNGYRSAEDYYTRVSARQYLPAIRSRCYLLQALDDPFFHPSIVPKATELGPRSTLELSRHGGHVGFLARAHQGGRHWLARHIVSLLSADIERVNRL